MRNKYAMANFKMNKTNEEVKAYLEELLPLIEGSNAKIVLGVPYTSLTTASKHGKKKNILIGYTFFQIRCKSTINK